MNAQEVEALSRCRGRRSSNSTSSSTSKIPPEVLVSINQIDEPGKLADTIASHLSA